MTGNKYNTKYLLSICLISAMGGLLFGYDWVVIGGAKPFYEPFFGISGNPVMQGWAMSCALIGCLAGAALSGWLSDRFGRKNLLILAALIFIFASLGTGAASSFMLFVIFRISGGIGIGLIIGGIVGYLSKGKAIKNEQKKKEIEALLKEKAALEKNAAP